MFPQHALRMTSCHAGSLQCWFETQLWELDYSVVALRNGAQTSLQNLMIAPKRGRSDPAQQASKCMHVNKSWKNSCQRWPQTNKCTCSSIIENKSADNTRLGLKSCSWKPEACYRQCFRPLCFDPRTSQLQSEPSANRFIAHRKCLKLSCNMSCVKCGVWRVQCKVWSLERKASLGIALQRGRVQAMLLDSNSATGSQEARSHGPGSRTARASSIDETSLKM